LPSGSSSAGSSALYGRSVPPGRRLTTDVMQAIVRALCGLAFLTLDPLWVLTLALFALGALTGVRTRAWLRRSR
jgi:hypothetical protein